MRLIDADMAIKYLTKVRMIGDSRPMTEIFAEIPSVDVLDKIRAEIEQIAKDYDKFDDYRRVRGLWIALDIIDKYRNKEGENES